MEAPEYFQNSFCPQFTPEKRHSFDNNNNKATNGGGGGGDHFMVEDLLDFSNDDAVITDGGATFDNVTGNSTESSTLTVVDSCNSSSLSGSEPNVIPDIGSRNIAEGPFSSDLCVPYDDLAELEWLSNFVEESFSSEDLQKLQLISGMKARPDESASETRQLQPERNRNDNAHNTTTTNNNPIFNPDVSPTSSSEQSDVVSSGPASPLPPPSSTGKKTVKSAPKKKESPEGPGGGTGGRPEVPALRDGQDAAVADRAHGSEDAVQRVRGPVQVRSARTRVPTRLEPDVRADEALQLAPQGAGASAPEGDGEGAAAVYSPSTAAAASPPPPSSPSEHGFRCIQWWRLLDSPTRGARLPAADLVGSVLE
ncbi:hypothetical protein GBA52_001328 [Prunus armeniaca]|nr:hypothetical protein GBA52_001328 [Prunus armeniaca]